MKKPKLIFTASNVAPAEQDLKFPKGSMFLLNMSKYKSGKKKGQYKYIEFKALPDWTLDKKKKS